MTEWEETELYDQLEEDYKAACKWAYDLLQRNDWLILDTETTGLLQDGGEIIQIALLRPDGTPLFESLVKPTRPIQPRAGYVNRITNEMVANAPSFAEIYPKLREVLVDSLIVSYNVAFDQAMFYQACHAASLEKPGNVWACAMLMYAQYVGDWNNYHGSYRWQKLPSAAHDALGDCRATLRLLKKMAEGHKPETQNDTQG